MAAATRRRRPEPEPDEDETPRRRRRVAEDEEETKPRRRRPEPEPDEEDDDEDVEEAPRARRRTSRNDDEEERPARRRPAGRTGTGRSGRADRAPGRRMARGWDGYQKVKAASSDFETKFKPSSEAQVVALLEAEPFAVFGRHWVDLDEGKRAYMCLGSLEADEEADDSGCPLCDVGHKPNGAKAYLNVAVLREGEKPSHEVWEIGPKISEMLEMIDKSIGRKTALTDIYIEVSTKGTGLNTKYFLEPLFEEDLEDLDLKPLSDKQRDAFELYDDEIYPIPSYKELDKIADEIA
jgi:hypothetical protein